MSDSLNQIQGRTIDAILDNRMRITDPTTGTSVRVNDDGQLHIVAESHLCTANSTTTPLLAGATWTGTPESITEYNGIALFITSDVASAVDGLEIQYSWDDGITWYTIETYTLIAGAEKMFTPPTFGVYFRLQYTNGAADQTAFALYTKLSKMPFKFSSHNIDDPIKDEDDAELVKAVITGKRVDGIFDNVSLTNGSNMKVSLEEIESGISSNSNSQLNVTPFHADGTEGALITGVAKGTDKDGIDAATNTLQSIDYNHAKIHSASHYFIEDVETLAINAVFDLQWTTPNTTKWGHFTFKLNCESETEWMIYEGATINVPGTTVTPINNNRNSVNTSVMTIAAISNSSLANANADTAVAGANELAHGIVGAGREGGVIKRGDEIVLKQNTVYCMRAIANAAGYINFLTAWYEHTNKG